MKKPSVTNIIERLENENMFSFDEKNDLSINIQKEYFSQVDASDNVIEILKISEGPKKRYVSKNMSGGCTVLETKYTSKYNYLENRNHLKKIRPSGWDYYFSVSSEGAGCIAVKEDDTQKVFCGKHQSEEIAELIVILKIFCYNIEQLYDSELE